MAARARYAGGRQGADTYVFGKGYGSDLIAEVRQSVDGTPQDTVAFAADIDPGDLTFSRGGADFSDLVIRVSGTNDVLTIQSQFGLDPRGSSVSSLPTAPSSPTAMC